MEYLINYYTNDLLDKLVCEGRYSMNSLSLMIPLSYAVKLIDLNWNDIYFAFINGYINNSEVVDFAVMSLNSDDLQKDDEFLNLVCSSSNGVDSEGIIIYLNNKIDKSTTDNSKEKFMYVVLSFLYDKRDYFEDVFRAIEVIYADFEYPKIMIPFVRYMSNNEKKFFDFPVDESELLYLNWQKYIEEQKIYYNQRDGSLSSVEE